MYYLSINQPQILRSFRELAAHNVYLSYSHFVLENSILSASVVMLWDIELGHAVTAFTVYEDEVMSLLFF
jgi:hypothetical protein